MLPLKDQYRACGRGILQSLLRRAVGVDCALVQEVMDNEQRHCEYRNNRSDICAMEDIVDDYPLLDCLKLKLF